MDLLDSGDCIIADKGFDIEEHLALLGAMLNIPLFFRGKVQYSNRELVETGCIASYEFMWKEP